MIPDSLIFGSDSVLSYFWRSSSGSECRSMPRFKLGLVFTEHVLQAVESFLWPQIEIFS